MPNKMQMRSGIVESLNVSPKGSYEGMLLKTSAGIIQINFPQSLSDQMSELARPGSHIHAHVKAKGLKENACHPVYDLVDLKTDSGQKLPANGNGDSGPNHFEAKIERLNYALHGEVNGAILDSGEFLHLKPHGASAVKLVPGAKVTGKGTPKPSAGRHRVLEAEEVNGIRLKVKSKPPKKHA